MEVIINGEVYDSAHATLSDVLRDWGAEPPVTVAVNQVFVPRHEHPHHQLTTGDVIEVLTPIQGG